jgi:hypothetical protein
MRIFPSPLAADVHRVDRARSIRKGVIVVSALVAVGAGVARWALPPDNNPASVARAYTEAQYGRDWADAWDLVCRSWRSAAGDAATDATNSWFEHLRVTPDVEVTISGVHGTSVRGHPAAVVTVTARIDGGREASGNVFVVEEEGKFRVCNEQAVPNT